MKYIKRLIILLLCIPTIILAYSDYIIPGGENIGISINTKGIIIVGTYELNGVDNAKKAGIIKGDIINKIDGEEVDKIEDLTNKLTPSKDKITLNIKRNNKYFDVTLPITKDNDVLKTGLYVKDEVTGIGTLSYIDPNTYIYGALGHEVVESNTSKQLEVKDGKIVSTNVTNIERSEIGSPGSKNATLEKETNGNILKNKKTGIFGKYIGELPDKRKYKVAKKENIKLGEAEILTVLKDKAIKSYKINILDIDDDQTKNILFEIVDKELLDEAGGIVQGMSGSPIIQKDYIIGAVTHVIVDNPVKGYGVFITNMLEDGERD